VERALRQTSATGDQRGFTLLELMLTVLIIGLLAGSVSLALPDTAAQRLLRDARRLEAQIALAAEQAIFRNSDYGLLIEHHGYRFLRLEQNAWQEVEPGSRLRAAPLDSETELRLKIDGVEVDTADQPQILMLSDGQLTPFELILSHSGLDHSQHIEAGFGGDLWRTEQAEP